MNGAGIGGGGFVTSHGAPGASGTITIEGTPIIVASGNYMDIGPGTGITGLPIGAVGQITIDGGNVYAINTPLVENQYGDSLGMVKMSVGTPGEELNFKAINGANNEYDYDATTDGNGDVFIWIPLGNQLIIHEDAANTILETVIEKFTTLGSNEIEPKNIPGYVTPNNQTVTWTGASLSPITFRYIGEAVLTLKAINLATMNEIEISPGVAITHDIPVSLNDFYDYSGDIAALTAAIDLEHPGRYALWVNTLPTIVQINSVTNTADVYYTLQPTTSGGGSGHGSAAIVDNNTANNNTSDSSNTTPTRLTILCVDENGNELFIQSLTTIVGSSEAINAPPLKGYELLTSQTIQNIRMETGENTITFRYTPTDDQQSSGEDRQNSSRWSLPWYIFVPIFIIGIAASFLIGQKIQKNK